MQTITKTFTAYTFNELSDTAKDNVRYTYFTENPWDSDNRATLDAFTELFPYLNFDIDRYNNVRITAKHYNDETLSLSGSRLHRWISNNLANYKDQYGRYIIREYGHCPLTGFCIDRDILEPLGRFYMGPDAYKAMYFTNWQSVTLHDLLTDCVTAFINACDREYEYLQSDEAISESCATNEHLFTSEGALI